MDWFVKAFVKASISWLGLGVTLGIAMIVHPAWTVHRTAHLHMNLLGFVAMMIFGVAYHVIPRFTGHSLHSRRLAGVHWWIANAGLACMAAGFMMIRGPGALRMVLLATGGSLSALGAYSFIYNIWRTIDGRVAATARAQPATPAPRRLPVNEAVP